ncbi:MAG: four helix bundle protein [Planctomycetes bacterium]|nr:four helix bundle protein [Planctomycetota bacterium]
MSRNEKARELTTRLVRFASDTFVLTTSLPKEPAGRHVGGQLVRSSSAIGASYQEACGAESRRDFIHKLRVADKEARESRYWLELIGERWREHAKPAGRLADEAGELSAILSASIGTALRRGGKRFGNEGL